MGLALRLQFFLESFVGSCVNPAVNLSAMNSWIELTHQVGASGCPLTPPLESDQDEISGATGRHRSGVSATEAIGKKVAGACGAPALRGRAEFWPRRRCYVLRLGEWATGFFGGHPERGRDCVTGLFGDATARLLFGRFLPAAGQQLVP